MSTHCCKGDEAQHSEHAQPHREMPANCTGNGHLHGELMPDALQLILSVRWLICGMQSLDQALSVDPDKLRNTMRPLPARY